MAHELARTNGKIAMAYRGEKPWHGLGAVIPTNATPDQIVELAGLHYELDTAPIQWQSIDGEPMRNYRDKVVMYRKDTNAPLAVVGRDYQVVQPREVVEFFADIADIAGASIETAGALFGGRRYWALARFDSDAFDVDGNGDTVDRFALMVSSCDGSLATQARDSLIRAVCNNTVSAALADTSAARVYVTHRSTFNPGAVREKFAQASKHYAAAREAMQALAKRAITTAKASEFVAALLRDDAKLRTADVTDTAGYKRIMALFDGAQIGGGAGTQWALLNAVTEYVDHDARAKTDELRFASAMFGRGDALKTAALTKLAAMVD